MIQIKIKRTTRSLNIGEYIKLFKGDREYAIPVEELFSMVESSFKHGDPLGKILRDAEKDGYDEEKKRLLGRFGEPMKQEEKAKIINDARVQPFTFSPGFLSDLPFSDLLALDAHYLTRPSCVKLHGIVRQAIDTKVNKHL